ncbi:MAG: hypothetical protein IJU66_01670 [Oscillospiraceae bacterium]|nr:hypothetical protein [Oscillospiraceae bacterium]
MEAISFFFGTVKPIVFREHGCDGDFAAQVRGHAEVLSCDAARFGAGKEAEQKLRETIAALLPGCFSRWPEGKLIMGSGSREILSELLEASLAAEGVTAKLDVRGVDLAEGQIDAYMEACGEALRESISPSVRTDGLADEAHGPLVHFGFSLFSHGMAAGSSSSSEDALDWNRDGSIILTSCCSAGGKSTRLEYRVKPEAAEKVRAFAARKHLAALSKQKIPTPAVFDNFTSSSINMTFDDRSIGGSPFEMLHIDCGPAGMTFRKIEDEIRSLFKECRDSGECIVREESGAGGMFGGMTGFVGTMGGFGTANAPGGAGVPLGQAWTCEKCGRTGNTSAFCADCAAPRPGGHAAAPVKPVENAEPGCWVCTSCGYGGNRGRFCSECGNPR